MTMVETGKAEVWSIKHLIIDENPLAMRIILNAHIHILEHLLFEQAGLLLYGGFDNTLAALGDCWRIDLASQPPTWIRSQNMGDANTAC